MIKLILLDIAVGRKVTTGGASRNKILPGEKSKCPGEVVIGEMDLRQPERVRITIFGDRSVIVPWIGLMGLTSEC